MTRLILHAGVHKTGTKTIQFALHDNREALSRAGIGYPEGMKWPGVLGRRSHNWIAQAFTGCYGIDLSRIDEAVAAALPGTATDDGLILSSENLSACCAGHRLWDAAAMRDFRGLQLEYLRHVANHFSRFDTQAVLVFRRTDDFAHSLYQTMIECDRTNLGFEDFLSIFSPLFDYRAQISAFERSFATTRVLSFRELAGRENFAGGFLDSVGLTGVRIGEAAPIKNAAVDARLIYWKQRTRADPDAQLARVFCRSGAARKLFADFGTATFWSTDLQREAVHRPNAEFAPGFFSEMKPQEGFRTAYVDDQELGRISEAFHLWKSARQKQPPLWQRMFGASRAFIPRHRA